MIKKLSVFLSILILISGCGYTAPPETAAVNYEAEVQETVLQPTAEPEKEPEPVLQEQVTAVNDDNIYAHDETVIENTCSLSVKCDEVLSNMEKLKDGKEAFIPENGVIFINEKAVIYEGETVFNVLSRELKKNSIHFEFSKTPAYNSMYIEGISNLYEFDCGDMSGWLYKVNGKNPGVGCSQYEVNNGDIIEFYYSCSIK